jgi:hypothetical protein
MQRQRETGSLRRMCRGGKSARRLRRAESILAQRDCVEFLGGCPGVDEAHLVAVIFRLLI